MSRVPFTLRIEAEEHSALENLSKIEKRPINQLVNEAIKSYLRQKGQKERSLEEHLRKLDAYRKQDPGFKRAIAAFVEAEMGLEDPAEGEPITRRAVQKRAKPVQRKIREIPGA